MMKNSIESELVSDYGYAIVADARGTIFCKQNSILVTGVLKAIYSPYYPVSRDYMEDFSIASIDDNVEIYIGDTRLITITLDELEMIVEDIKSRHNNNL